MNRIKKILLWGMLLCLGSILCGCAKEEKLEKRQAEQKECGQEEKLQIGMSFDSFVIERWTRDRDVFVSTAKGLGADVNVQNANGDVKEQISQIEYFIQKGMDVIVIIAVDGGKLGDVVEKAHREGSKVIAYDRLILNAGVDLYVSFDNKMVGKMMGQALVDKIPEGGDVFVINGPTFDHNVVMVEEGFREAIEKSDLNVVYAQYCDGWLAELAFQYVNDGLTKHPGIAGVMCGNDDLASQAFRALAENRLAGKTVLVGQDAELSACQRIIEGTQTMTVYKPVEDLAKSAAVFAVKLAKGEEIEANSEMDDGIQQVPYESVKPIAVTKDNMNVIIESGFHTEEDVYLNVSK